MMGDPRSHGLWEASAPPAPATMALSGDHQADVAIVGGGYTGLSAALHLAEAGVRVILLEARDFGFGGAGRNVGLINAGMWVMPDEFPKELGPVYGERLLDLLGNGPALVREMIARHAIACELETAGTLHCAVGASGIKEIEERAEQWQRRGAAVSILSREETAKRTGSTAYEGALLDLRAGTLQPLAYARGLAHAAIRAGAILYSQSPVTAISRTASGHVLSTAKGRVTASQVITATDAYSEGPFAALAREQVRLPYFNFATRPLGDNLKRAILPGREGAWDTKEVLTSFRMDQAGRLVFGSVGALRGTGLAVHKGWAYRAMTSLFPILSDVEFEHEWYGQIGMTDNALPRLHRMAPGVIGFSGYNGRGISPGTTFGKVLADHLIGKTSEADLPLPFSPIEEASLRGLKEAWYEAGAQVVHFAGARF